MIRLMRVAGPIVSIVVVGTGDAPLLIRCLESVAGSVEDVDYDVHVVLCDPTPRLVKELGRQVAGAHISTFRANLGVAGARNFAAARCQGKYISFLGDDCVVQPGWLGSLVDTAERRKGCGIVTSTLVNEDGTIHEAGRVLDPDGSTNGVGEGSALGFMAFERRVLFGSAKSWLVRRETWEQVGGMSDAYYPAYYEDLDFCLSAKKAGWDTWYQPASTAVHSASADSTSTARTFLQERSRSAFHARWGHILSESERASSLEASVWRDMGCPTRILVIDDEVPDPSRGSGYGRMQDNLAALAEQPEFHVALHPRKPGFPHICPIPGVRIVPDLWNHLKAPGVGYEVVIVSRPSNAEIFRALIDMALPHALKVYDAEALFYRRLELQALVADTGSADLADDADDMRAREKSIFEWADRVTCISAEEADIARTLAPTQVAVVSPLFRALQPTRAAFWDRTGVGFIAGWAAGPGSPNSDGLLWFAREVMPRIIAGYPGFRLRVTGYDPPEDVRWLGGGPVDFVGEVADLTEFYNQIRVAISPTRFGSGVKLKTVEAIQYGVPVVSTDEAARGLPPALGRAAWVTSDAEEFAEAVTLLLSDEATWDRQRSSCLDALADHHNRPVDNTTTWPTLVRDLVG